MPHDCQCQKDAKQMGFVSLRMPIALLKIKNIKGLGETDLPLMLCSKKSWLKRGLRDTQHGSPERFQ